MSSSQSTVQAAHEIRPARLTDVPAILALLPELAAFDIPERRDARHLWEGDAKTLELWAQGRAPHCLIHVADSGTDIDGFTIVTLREELMSHAPSSHLEAIAVHERARGKGLGKRLLANAEAVARDAGATSITLHVFGRNERARAVYRKAGYDEELIRDIKYLD